MQRRVVADGPTYPHPHELAGFLRSGHGVVDVAGDVQRLYRRTIQEASRSRWVVRRLREELARIARTVREVGLVLDARILMLE